MLQNLLTILGLCMGGSSMHAPALPPPAILELEDEERGDGGMDALVGVRLQRLLTSLYCMAIWGGYHYRARLMVCSDDVLCNAVQETASAGMALVSLWAGWELAVTAYDIYRDIGDDNNGVGIDELDEGGV